MGFNQFESRKILRKTTQDAYDALETKNKHAQQILEKIVKINEKLPPHVNLACRYLKKDLIALHEEIDHQRQSKTLVEHQVAYKKLHDSQDALLERLVAFEGLLCHESSLPAVDTVEEDGLFNQGCEDIDEPRTKKFEVSSVVPEVAVTPAVEEVHQPDDVSALRLWINRYQWPLRGLLNGAFYSLVAVSLLFVTFFGMFNHEGVGAPRQFFGFSVMRVATGSMAPTLRVNTIIVVHAVPVESLAVGDVVTFVNGENKSVTHRIYDFYEGYTSEVGFLLMGDANQVVDGEIYFAHQFVGRYVFASHGLGRFLTFVETHFVFATVLTVLVLVGLSFLKIRIALKKDETLS